MRSEYKLTINSKGANAVFMITYMNGRFKKLEQKSGKLASQQQHDKLMLLAPQLDKAILLLQQEFKDVSWERIDNDNDNASLMKYCLDFYYSWYQDKNEIKPKITGTETKALKQVLAYLQKECSTEDEVKIIFQSIFDNWNNFSSFYQSQMELRQINSNLNTLLRLIKHGEFTGTNKTESVSDPLREKFKKS